MENLTQNNAPTFESVWASLQENARLQKENEQLLKQSRAESDRRHKKREQELSEMRQYFKERDEKKDKEWANYEEE